jgi:hypothetical protein
MTEGGPTMTDLATMPLAEIAAFDFRAEGRDPVADARAVHARVAAALKAVPDAAWATPVSASDAPGATPWTLSDHVGHVIDSIDEAAGYTWAVIDGGASWPVVEDYGDMDAWNEERRALFAGKSPAELRALYDAATERLVDVVQGLDAEAAASDDAWDWAWSLLEEHPAEHAAFAESLGAASR